MKRQARIDRLQGIWLEYLVAASASALLEARLDEDPAFGSSGGWRRRDVTRWRSNLEATFLIRMFAEFEANLRDAWEGRYRQKTQPPMKDLLIAISARTMMTGRWQIAADAVRVYRNSLIHASQDDPAIIPLDEAQSRLVRFLSRLPLDW